MTKLMQCKGAHSQVSFEWILRDIISATGQDQYFKR